MSHPDSRITHWRDVPGLTPRQTASLANMETRQFENGLMYDTDDLLRMARRLQADTLLNDVMMAGITPPDDANHVSRWMGNSANVHRQFTGTRRDVTGDLEACRHCEDCDHVDDQVGWVEITGVQFSDGTVRRRVAEPYCRGSLTPTDARALAATLIAAADEIDRLEQ
jgi:hypothetical protein